MIMLRLFYIIGIDIASCERFLKLKLIDNYLQSSMSQLGLTRGSTALWRALLSIEHKIINEIDI